MMHEMRTMKYRLLIGTVIAALFILLTPFTDRVYAAGAVKLKDDEAFVSDGINWDGKTLTLNGCNYNGQIKLPKNSTVNVQGVNNLVMSSIYDEGGVLIGEGPITITGGGVLNVTNAVVTHDTCYAIVGKKELTIQNVTINAAATAQGAADISAGIVSRKAMKITGSNITATGCDGARTSAGIRGIKNVSIAASNITASGTSYGIVSGDAMGITASNINATGGKGAVKAKNALQLAGMSGGSAGEKSDRWYVMNGSDKATKVSLKY